MSYKANMTGMSKNQDDFGQSKGFNQTQNSLINNPASLKGKLISLEV